MTNDIETEPIVLTLGMGHAMDASFGALRIVEAATVEEVLELLYRKSVAVLLLGPYLRPADAVSVLTHLTLSSPEAETATIVLCAGQEPSVFQKSIDSGHIFYLARGEISSSQLSLLIRAAISRVSSAVSGSDLQAVDVAAPNSLLDFCIRLPMQGDVAEAGGLTVETTISLVNAEQAQCLMYYADEDILIRSDGISGQDNWNTAATGLAGFVVRTGSPIRLDRGDSDPRYDCETDNPTGLKHPRFLGQPVFGLQGSLLGVITAVRKGASLPFSVEDSGVLSRIAQFASPTLNQLLLQSHAQKLLIDQNRPKGPSASVFRDEALEHHIRGWDDHGNVLRVLPPWLHRSHWALLVLVLMGMVAGIVGKSYQHADGIAVVCSARNGSPSGHLASDASHEVVAFFSTRYVSQLHNGMSIRVRWDEDSIPSQTLAIHSIDSDLTTIETAQLVGLDATKLLPLTGKVVAVHANMLFPSSAGQASYTYHDGMTGKADIAVAAEPIIFSIAPGLKRMLGRVY
jgi:hypothetical protein